MVTNCISSRDYVSCENYSNYIHFLNWFEKWFILASNLIFTLFKSRTILSNKRQGLWNKHESSSEQNIFSAYMLMVKKKMMN